MSYSVYKHTFPNGKVYIGITSRKPEYRWSNGYGYKKQPLVYKAIFKYGWENIEHEILLKNLTKKEAEEKEIELIARYQSNDRNFGYNIANGGNIIGSLSEETKKKISESNKGRKLSNETKKKIGMANKGKIPSEESRRKNSEAHKGNNHPQYGTHRSEETKRKISNAHKGKNFSEEHKTKLSESHKKENLSKETLKKMSESHKGIRQTKETIEKRVKSLKGMKRDLAYLHQRNKKMIYCVETEKTYNSIVSAYEETGVSKGNISSVCNGKRKTAGGFHWKYADIEVD